MIDFLARLFIKERANADAASSRLAYGQMAGIVCIVCNVALCAAKALVGMAAGSAATVADAINNLGDASSNVVSLLGFKLASRPADPAHPYGHGRYEYLAGLVVSVLVSAAGIELIRTGIERILNPAPVEMSVLLIVVLVASVLVKLWMSCFNHAIAARIDSETLEAAAADSRNDVLATLAVLACTAASAWTGAALDGWVSAAIGIYVLVSGLQLVSDTLTPLLGSAPSEELVAHIRQKILSYPGVLGTHDLMVHDYGPGRTFASAHVEMAAEADPLQSHDVIDNIEQDFLANEGLVMTIHYDPIVTNDPGLHDLRNWIENQAEALAPGASVHDVRRVPGPTHTNVIFDLVRPAGCSLSADELEAAMAAQVQKRYKDAVCKITVDESYVSTKQ